jgi:hypothetical protein
MLSMVLMGGLPVMYETKKAAECKIDESELYKSDMNGFNTKVGVSDKS